MIRDQFFTNSNGYDALAGKLNFDLAWKKVLKYEQEHGVSLDDELTRDDYVDMFNSMKIRHTSSFSNFKTAIMAYIRFCITNGALPEKQEDVLSSITFEDLNIRNSKTVHYHKNLSTLQFAIEDTVHSSDNYDDTLHDLPIAILYLAWFGLTEDEIINLPKSAVLDDGVMLNGKKIEMPFSVTQVLNRLKNADGYYQQAKGVIFHKYMYSEYLIRTERKPQIDLSNLRSSLSRFNSISDKLYSLRYDVVHRSGIFWRAYCLECESREFNIDDQKFASEVFCEELGTRSKHLSMMKEYTLYKQLFS